LRKSFATGASTRVALAPRNAADVAPKKLPFLSEAWIAEVKALRERYEGPLAKTPAPLRMNQHITDVPFGDGELQAHLDTTSGEVELEFGFLADADLQVTLDYETARAIFVDLDAQAAMAAFLSGKIRVDGDLTKLMAMQDLFSPSAQAIELAQAIREITE
jgi:hypothetical protein